MPGKASVIDYAKYGSDMPKKLIDAMLADKRFQREMKRVRQNEGGYNNDSADRGKETKFGISKKWYPNEDIKNLTRERADAILYRDFWLANGINKLPDELVGKVFDVAIPQGPVTAIQHLHNALGITPGTIIGDQTLSKLEKYTDYTDILNRFKENVRNRYIEISEKDSTQKKYINGWLNRVNRY